MKMAKRLLLLLLFILVAFGVGCLHSEKKEVKKAIQNEMDQLKTLNSETAQKYIPSETLFPETETESDSDAAKEIQEVFSLFYQNFNYKILSIEVSRDRQSATASLRLTTLDAGAFAKDFTAAKLKQEIIYAANDAETDTGDSSLSTADLYSIMKELLQTQNYDTVEQNSTISLSHSSDDTWEIERTYAFENDLVGGLMTKLADSDILPPEDTLSVYLETLKEMNVEEMSSFLGVESLLNSTDAQKNAIASALVEQVHQNFNYEFGETTQNGYQAEVSVTITTFDSTAILASYESELEEYLSSADAVIDGLSKRTEKSYAVLLNNIEANTATTSSEIKLTLTNNGISWQLEDPDGALGNAIFGTLATVEETIE